MEHQPKKYQPCFPNDVQGIEMSVLGGLEGRDNFASNGSTSFARFNCLWLNLCLKREAES